MRLSREIEFIKQLLSPYTNRVYIVGGYTRDHYLQNSTKDIDLEVYNIDSKLFTSLMSKIDAKGVGKNFFVYKYKNIDISLPRIETKNGYGHRAFSVQITNNEKLASQRRDFKMNSIMYNIFTKEIIDFWGGLSDIESKRISIIDENKFREDSLRVLRAIQFSARFRFKIYDIEILKSIDLDDISKERIFLEFEKLFKSDNYHYGLYYIMLLDIDKKLFNYNTSYKEFYIFTKEYLNYKKYFNQEFKEFYFLYLLKLKIPKLYINIINNLHLPKSYIKIVDNSTQNIDISAKELLKISLKTPIKDWLGGYKYINTAKELGVYYRKFDTKISVQDVIKDGFKSQDISIELERRELESIYRFLIKE